MGLNTEQYVALEQLKAMAQMCGGGKCTVFLGGGAMPTMQVR
jgi:hypothetical protein